jgi:hypothetical protein
MNQCVRFMAECRRLEQQGDQARHDIRDSDVQERLEERGANVC